MSSSFLLSSLRAAATAAALVGIASAQGANNCGNAQPISGEGTFSVDTNGATTDGPSACGNFGRDVWFAWTADATDTFVFDTCAFASYDTTLAAYSGSCGSLNQLSCNDDTCSLRSSVGFSAVNGTTYLIRVGGFSGATGTATLTVTQGLGGDCGNPAPGPDVIVGGIPNISNYGASGGIAAYSLGTTSCNVGTAELNWIANNNQHPVIGQNIYRMENGRFEMIGMSYLKHGFTALQQNLCCSCNSSGTGSRLGVGCSDPYGSSLNGSQGGLGPRWQVNAHTGAFSYPYSQQGQTGNNIFKRIQVPNADVDPGQHPSALYFGEAQYITPDDAAAGNGTNNVSWCDLSRPGSQTGGAWRLSIGGSTHRQEPAILAWAANDAGVNIEEINVPGEGQFVLGSNVIDNGNGTWRYEYAIFNNTSHYSGQSFEVPIGSNVNVTNVGMSFPQYHSGEPYTNTPWNSNVSGSSVTWATQTHAQNSNANALRWGTTYSFWFTADAGPETKSGSLGLFRPGNPGDQTVAVEGPMDGMGGGQVTYTNYCTANANSTGQTSKILASNADLMARTMDLEAYDMPQNAFGFFITSTTQAFIPNAGGSAGNLCIAGDIGRGVAGGIHSTGMTGSFAGVVDLDNIPLPMGSTTVMAGETRNFQGWHRDAVLGVATSNFTDGVAVSFP